MQECGRVVDVRVKAGKSRNRRSRRRLQAALQRVRRKTSE